jgi:homoserine/homoserine lactone efflux protein
MSIDFLIIFSVTVFIASIIPSPSMLLALTHGINFGAKRSIASALGNITITFVQASVSIAGLGSILIASESVFQIIKLLGAVYLIYMGINILRSSKLLFADESDYKIKNSSFKKMFIRSALVTAGNPKAILFFTAVFPQFINTKSDFLIQFCVLMTICLIIAFICFMIYAVCGQKVMTIFLKYTIGNYLKKIIGGTFIGAGIGLALSRK